MDQPDRNDSPKNLSGSAVLGKDQPDRNDSEERVPEFRGSVVPRFGYS